MAESTENGNIKVYQSDYIYSCPNCKKKLWSIDSYMIHGKKRVFELKCVKCDGSLTVSSDAFCRHFMQYSRS